MKLNFNFDGKTLLKKWWQIVRDNFTTIQTDHNELQTAHNTLSNKVDKEIQDRQSDTSSLTGKINTETQQRQFADNALQRSIDTETANRQTDHNTLSDNINTHKTTKVIDHPDKSVTSTKIADYAITTDKVANSSITTTKLAMDIVENLGKADTFLYSDGEPVYLSECKDTGGTGYEVPDIPVNVFFKFENDTDSALTKFQTHDDHYTTLSCDIAPGEVRICVLIQEEVSGADPQNGYLFVLDDKSIRKLLDGKAPTKHTSTTNTYGAGNGLIYGHLKLSDSVSSTSHINNGIAATPKAVKTAYDKAVSAYDLANDAVDHSTDAYSLAESKLDKTFSSNGYTTIDEITSKLDQKIEASDIAYDGWVWNKIAEIFVDDFVAPVGTNGFGGMQEVVERAADDVRSTTIVVGASDSKYHTEHISAVDYICGGTNDQTTIQSAISALPSTGGKIVLLDGTYNIGGTITINKSNVTIQGLGRNVILKAATSTATLEMFSVSNATGLIISDIVIDYANNTSDSSTAIKLYSSDNAIIEHINILNHKGNGIEWFNCNYTRFSDISFINVRQCIWDRGRNHSSIIDKWIVDTVTNGITLDSSSTLNKIADCIVRSATDNGIKSDAAYTMINDNIVYGCSNGITVNGNCSTVADNNVRDSDIGISVNGKYVNVSGNTAIRADGSGNISSYSSSQYTILMGSSSANCLVIGNIIGGKNYTNNGATTNTFANNKY